MKMEPDKLMKLTNEASEKVVISLMQGSVDFVDDCQVIAAGEFTITTSLPLGTCQETLSNIEAEISRSIINLGYLANVATSTRETEKLISATFRVQII